MRAILGGRADNPEYTTLSEGRRILRNWLFGVAMALLVIAAARLYWGTRILPYSGKGRDLMILLDVSKSMLAQDVKPSRLEHAKWFLRELIKKCPGDRFGLIAFSGSAFLECPMTVDKTSLFQTIDEMSAGSIPLGGTNIQVAIETSMTAFEAAEGSHRAIILVSDGDELQGDSSKAVADVQNRKIPLFVVGIGDPSQPGLIMLSGEKNKETAFLRDKKGELVKSALNEKQLGSLALNTSGIYVRSTATDSGLEPVLKRIKNLVPEEYERGKNTRPIERFHIPLLAALILLLARMGIGERRSPAFPAILLFFALANFAGFADDEKNGGKTASVRAEAAAGEKKSVRTAKSSAEIYNTALGMQKNNELEKASELYENAINSSEEKNGVHTKAYQNLGVISHEKARKVLTSDPDEALKVLNYAEEMYIESMRTAPDAKDVAMNQQKLLNDRVLAEQIKKQRQELEKKRQEAQDKTQEAYDRQKKQNEEKKTEKEKRQDSEQKKQTQNKTQEAEKTVENYKNEARKQDSKESEQSASKAQEEIKKAQKEQKQGDDEKAEESLKKALEELGAGKKEDKQKEKKNGEEKEDKKEQETPENQPVKNENSQIQQEEQKEEREIDPSQAEALLDLMANDEKTLRDELKERQKINSRIKEVEKDW